jgi:hypothetical protein
MDAEHDPMSMPAPCGQKKRAGTKPALTERGGGFLEMELNAPENFL